MDDLDKLREEMRCSLRKNFLVGGGMNEIMPKFRAWCQERGLDYAGQKMGGRNFQRFKKEIKRRNRETEARIEALAELIVFAPAGAQENGSIRMVAWNKCVFTAIETGAIPPPYWEEAETAGGRARAQGWNKAREKMAAEYGKSFKRVKGT